MVIERDIVLLSMTIFISLPGYKTKRRMPKIYPYILLILVVLFFSGNILVGKALTALPPFTIAFFRLVIAFLVLFPIGIRSALEYREKYLEYKTPLVIMTLSGVTFFNTFIYGALQFTTPMNVAILETVIPIVTVVLSSFLLKEVLSPLQIIGIVLSLIGAIWVITDGGIFYLATISWNIGDAIMIGAIVAWAVYSIMVKRYIKLFPAYGTLLVMTGISIVVLLPIVLIEWYLKGVPSLNFATINGLLYLGIFPSVIAQSFYNRAVALTSPSQASVFLNFLPVVTMAGSYLWFGERITMKQIIGTLAVICGVLLTTELLDKRKKHINKIKRKASN